MADELLRRAKAQAGREGRTLTSLIEEGLRLVLSQPRGTGGQIDLPVSVARGGLHPGVDLNRSRRLADLMDEE